MNSEAVVFYCPPYLTQTPSDFGIGSNPVESDMSVIFTKAFQKYGKVPFFPVEWLQQDGQIRANLDSFEECLKQANSVAETVKVIFVWNCKPHDSPKMTEVFSRLDDFKNLHNNVKVISMIPDSWYGSFRGHPDKYKDYFQSYANVCDKTIVFCDSVIPFLRHLGANEMADKVHYIPFLPILLNEHKFENKSLDLCFIGTVRGARRTAFDTVRNAFPEMNHYFYDGGRNLHGSQIREYQSYLDKIGDSVYTVTTSTRPAFKEGDFLFSSVVPGRFCESLVSMTILIYFQENDDDFLPKIVHESGCCVYIKAGDTKEQVIEKITKTPVEEIRKNMMKFYHEYMAPDVVLPKILDMNYER